jgi:hypothetical protein
VVFVIANNMSSVQRRQKVIDRPSVSPVDATVGISNKHCPDSRVINRKEAMHGIDRTVQPGLVDDHGRV